jgi:hypothetical protein
MLPSPARACLTYEKDEAQVLREFAQAARREKQRYSEGDDSGDD